MCYILAIGVKLELGLFTQIICIYLKIMLDLYWFFAVYLGVDGEEKTMGWRVYLKILVT